MNDHTNTPEEDGGRITRRGSLVSLGGVVATALTAGGVKVAVSRAAGEADAASNGPAAVASGAVSCVLSPEMTAGPYYLEGDKVRRDIREGRPGVPLALRLSVLDVSTCKPIKGAAVDIWHCDTGGTYSGFAQEGTDGLTFLRGIQRTDANGLALFQTVYPGWYPGRAVHIHTSVYLGGNVVHTGQFFFPDKLTDTVYTKAPYSSRPNRDMRNATDSIFRNGGSRSILKLAKRGTGYVGSIAMGVQRA
jgi:protocatechuate 3,4-dioxygenase beta subunit